MLPIRFIQNISTFHQGLFRKSPSRLFFIMASSLALGFKSLVCSTMFCFQEKKRRDNCFLKPGPNWVASVRIQKLWSFSGWSGWNKTDTKESWKNSVLGVFRTWWAQMLRRCSKMTTWFPSSSSDLKIPAIVGSFVRWIAHTWRRPCSCCEQRRDHVSVEAGPMGYSCSW